MAKGGEIWPEAYYRPGQGAEALREQGVGATVARQMKIGRATVYKILQSRQKRSK